MEATEVSDRDHMSSHCEYAPRDNFLPGKLHGDFTDKKEEEISMSTIIAAAACSVATIGGSIYWIETAQAVLRSHGLDVTETPIVVPIVTAIAGVFAACIVTDAAISAIKRHKHMSNPFHKTYKVQNQMYCSIDKSPMIFPEGGAHEFNFDSLIGDESFQTVCGFPVRIDKVMRDITKTTVLGVSGTMVVRGVKIRGVWDSFGNIMECRKILSLNAPSKIFVSIDRILGDAPESIFRLVSVKQPS